jgi:type I restriction enzyme S subunit
MKDSGVEWIGEIPDGWEVKKIKYLGTVKSGDAIKSEEIRDFGEYPVYGGNGVLGYYNDFNFSKPILSIGRVGEKCGVVHLVMERAWINDNSLVFETTIEESVLQFIFRILVTRNLNLLRNQNTQPLITGSMVKNESIPYPPIQEQQQIVTYLDQKTKEIDDLIASEKKRIELMKEYRQSLISEVVTGKIKITN